MSPIRNHLPEAKELSLFIKNEASALGFFDCGISRAEFLKEDSERVEQWIENGHHASMSYMERNREKRYNPELLVEKAKSVITVLYNYYPQTKLPDNNNYKISKYAYGKDYHFVIKEKLNRLLKKIEEKAGERIARILLTRRRFSTEHGQPGADWGLLEKTRYWSIKKAALSFLSGR